MNTKLANYLIAIALLLSVFSCDDDSEPATLGISDYLTTTKTAYENATKGDWITVTEAEYNALATNLTNITIAGSVDSLFEDEANLFNNAGGYTWSNSGSATMPAGSYLFAFKYRSISTTASTTSTVKISTTGKYADLNDFGSVLPSHAGDQVYYFVIKDSDTPIATDKTGYLAMYFAQGGKYWHVSSASTNVDTKMQYNPGNKTSTPETSNGVLLYQGLSTTEKQW